MQLSKASIITVTAVSVLFAASEASAAHFKTGLWKASEYQESNGVRTPCHFGSCIILPPSLDPKIDESLTNDQVCVPTDILEKAVNQTLEVRALIIGRAGKNCKATDPKTSAAEHSTGLICDDLTLSQKMSYPDNEHITSTTIARSTAESGPNSGSMTMVQEYEWLGPDCGNTTTVIREMPGNLPTH